MPLDLFNFESAASVADWSAIDDAVMGGASRSRMRHDPAGHAVFDGSVSPENGGGFASVRTRPLDLGHADVAAYLLEVRGDGKRYKLNLRTDDTFDGVNHQAAFEAPAGNWALVRLPLSMFAPKFRGRSVAGAGRKNLDARQVAARRWYRTRSGPSGQPLSAPARSARIRLILL